MSKNGSYLYRQQDRPYNSESFGEYVDELLGKFEEDGLKRVALVMDNVRFHHCAEVEEKILAKGHYLSLHIHHF
jgi:DDE superfamily endonuclease